MTAVSVRALRFYDRIGLLSPSGRTEAGYRLYSDADLVRLEQILALKFLGFSLGEIKRFLAPPPVGLREALAQQRAMLREQRDRLDVVIEAAEHAERVMMDEGGDWDALVSVIRAIQMNQSNDWQRKYFTDEQLTAMEEIGRGAYSDGAHAALAARPAWTEEDQRRVDEEYAALYAGVRGAVAAGEEPGGAAAQALAGQAIALIEAFTGGNAAVAEGLQAWWKGYDALPAAQRPFPTPLTDEEGSFLEKAKAIYNERRAAGGVG
ncbi:MAG: MerR family transcriptional regulator [Dehalococcoidia bacterium]